MVFHSHSDFQFACLLLWTLTTLFVQEILALTGGGSTREYTETRPDGSTVTYTIDVEEEEYEVVTCCLPLARDRNVATT